MQIVVITGSTRGIGYGLADEFLKRDCAVVINGRSENSVEQARKQLSLHRDSARIEGFACDVSDYQQVQALWNSAIARFGKVDYWINNAGITLFRSKIHEASPEQLKNLVDINLTGAMNGSHLAINGMLKQGYGQIFNMLGHGSNGRKQAGLSPYGMSKYGLQYLSDSLAIEMENTGVKIGTLRPGMVITELLTAELDEKPEDEKRLRQVFNILADRVETVTPFLVDKMLANEKNGTAIKWLTTPKIIWRFLTASFSKRNVLD